MTPLDEIESHIPALGRYAHALLRDRDGADDLVQDCLERAVARRHLLRADGSIRGWLFTILLNRFRDGRRRIRSRPDIVPLDSAAEPVRPGGQEAHLALSEVHAAMGRLPEEQRAALLLVAVDGMSVAEAARAIGVPEGTVASRVARARAHLRQMTAQPNPRAPTRERRP